MGHLCTQPCLCLIIKEMSPGAGIPSQHSVVLG